MDTSGVVGGNLDLAVGPSGAVHLTYYDDTNDDLRYATCAASCATSGGWTSLAIQTFSQVGQWSAIGVDGGGGLHVAFYGIGGRDDLAYAACTASCTSAASWDTVTVDSAGIGGAGRYLDLAVDAGGAAHVSYERDADLYYARCTASCTAAGSWQRVAVDTTDPILDEGTAIAVGPGGRVHIAYYEDAGADIKYATCAAACTTAASWQTALVTGAATGTFLGPPGIAVGSGGAVHLSFRYFDQADLWYAACTASCTSAASWQTAAIDTAGSVGQFSALAVAPDGSLRIAYSFFGAGAGAVRYGSCPSGCTASGSWSTVPVEAAASTVLGGSVSLGLGSGGAPRVAYMDLTRGDVRYGQ